MGEALLAELPVVAYDLPAYRHFGDRIERLPTGDADALVGAAVRALGDGRSSTGDPLPGWEPILDAEIERMAAQRNQ